MSTNNSAITNNMMKVVEQEEAEDSPNLREMVSPPTMPFARLDRIPNVIAPQAVDARWESYEKYNKLMQLYSLSTLGHMIDGGMSSIYTAQDDQGRSIAIKLTAVEMRQDGDEAHKRRCLVDATNEFEVLSRVKDHPNIVPPLKFEIYQKSDMLYAFMSMPLYSCTLKEDADSRSFAELLKYFTEIASALDYLEKQCICHCDIKLENILIKDKQAHLCDFGVSIDFHKEPLSYWIRNTLKLDRLKGLTMHYAPPEIMSLIDDRLITEELKTIGLKQLADNAFVMRPTQEQSVTINPNSSDIYSLGLTFIYAFHKYLSWDITRKPTYYTFLKQVKKPSVAPSEVEDTKKLILLLAGMIKTEPEERPPFYIIKTILENFGKLTAEQIRDILSIPFIN